ncbi:phosphoribosylamine--glycine ligase [bacterium]|nr:phosphoribosylamine--glycine ligase [bacterium]
MKVLVVGSGGREHALTWKLLQSPKVERIYCAPGNGGIGKIAECIPIDVTDFKGLIHFAQKKKIDLTVVGPELPLTEGIVDRFQEKGLKIFGPNQKAAEIEGSKVFAKDFMAKYRIPTAQYRSFTDPEKTVQYINQQSTPLVLKADGLAAGKGVLVCHSRAEAYEGIDRIMRERDFGNAGSRLVVEEFLTGEEASILTVTDGEDMVLLPAAQDHKAIFEGDKGPNTGGMGAYAPATVIDQKLLEIIKQKILLPTIQGMKEEGRPYKGVLYVGLMITKAGPKVLEYNCRFGDPEIQAILPLLRSDLIDLLLASVEGNISKVAPKIKHESAVCVVMASGGYPGAYEKDKVIKGLGQIDKSIIVFHAGTKIKGDNIMTSGGRVIGVTALGQTIRAAIDRVYKNVGKITFDGAYYRKDIGYRALSRQITKY